MEFAFKNWKSCSMQERVSQFWVHQKICSKYVQVSTIFITIHVCMEFKDKTRCSCFQQCSYLILVIFSARKRAKWSGTTIPRNHSSSIFLSWVCTHLMWACRQRSWWSRWAFMIIIMVIMVVWGCWGVLWTLLSEQGDKEKRIFPALSHISL